MLPLRRARLSPAEASAVPRAFLPSPRPGRGCSAVRAAIERDRGVRARLCAGVTALGTSRWKCCVIVREGCEQVREKFFLALEMRILGERKDEGWKLSVRWKNV